jgi:uncharacterized membrane protein
MKYRMATALLSLVGLLVAGYLYLYKIGVVGTMVCGTGACELVQTSRYSRFLGVEVSLIGVLGYGLLFGVGLAWLQSGDSKRRWPGALTLALSAGGLLFSAYLTYLELFVLHAICRWCVGSAVIVLAIFITSLLGRRQAPAGIA